MCLLISVAIVVDSCVAVARGGMGLMSIYNHIIIGGIKVICAMGG